MNKNISKLIMFVVFSCFIGLITVSVASGAEYAECWTLDGNQSGCNALSPNCTWMPAASNAWCTANDYGSGDAGCCDMPDCAQWDGDYDSCAGSDGQTLNCEWFNNAGNQEPWCDIKAGNAEWKYGITNSTNIGCCGKDFANSGCWSRDNTNETYCTNSNFIEGMCIWDDSDMCPEPDGCCFMGGCSDANTSDGCNALITNGMPCEWDGVDTCSDKGFEGFEFDACMDNFGFWNGTSCESFDYGEGLFDFASDVRCWFADNNPDVCGNITGCVYCAAGSGEGGINNASSFCYGKQAGWCEGHDPSATGFTDAADDAMECSDIEVKNTCDCGALPGCSWNSSGNNVGTYCAQGASSCALNYNDIDIGAVEDIMTCEDAGTNETICNQLKQDYFLPCAFNLSNSGECGFDFVGGGGFGGTDKEGGFKFNDLETETSCNFAGGQWACVDIDAYDNQDCWCDFMFGQGTEDCDDSCWACEFQADGTNWADSSDAQTACEASDAAGGNCEWHLDSNAFNEQGWCDFPEIMEKGFVGGGNCENNCFDCFEQNMCDNSLANCTWMTDSFNVDWGWCDPAALAQFKDVDNNCMAAWNQAECEASTKAEGCHWNDTYATDPFSGNAVELCLENGTSPEICFIPGDEDGDGDEDCADSECSQDPMCGWGIGEMDNKGLFMKDDNICISMDETNQSVCEAIVINTSVSGGTNATIGYYNGSARNYTNLPDHLSGQQLCYYWTTMGGEELCDPLFEQHMMGEMDLEKPPIILGADADDVTNNDHLDILDVGVHDDPFGENMNLGFALVNATESAICNNAGGTSNGTYIRYIDSDGNATNGCDVPFGVGADYNGYDYKLFLKGTYDGADANTETFAYRCVSGEWTLMQGISLNTVDDACSMTDCGPVDNQFGGECTASFQGINVLVLKKSNFEIMTDDLRILVATFESDNESVVTDEAGPFVYTPGSVDFKMEDCFGFTDMDGDGLTPDQDPDCKYIKQFGYQPFEYDCNDDLDNDGDGDTDENDADCEHNPLAGGTFGFVADAEDTTAPSATFHKINEFGDGAFITIDTNEPANLSVLFYNTDTECMQINETLNDVGETCADNWCDYDDYKPFHGVELDGLTNDTTYYYKYVVCDPSGNCAYSACTNLTTGSEVDNFYFGAIPPTGYEVDFGGNDITDMAASVNSSNTMNKNLTIECPDTGYEMKFVSVDVKGAENIDLSDVVCNATNDVVGIGSDTWNNLVSKLTPDSTQITWATGGDNITSIKNCNATGGDCSADVKEYLDCEIGANSTTCNIPTTLGYSTYNLVTGSAAASSSSTSGGGAGTDEENATIENATSEDTSLDAITADESIIEAFFSGKYSMWIYMGAGLVIVGLAVAGFYLYRKKS